jgi:hypothetical protein
LSVKHLAGSIFANSLPLLTILCCRLTLVEGSKAGADIRDMNEPISIYKGIIASARESPAKTYRSEAERPMRGLGKVGALKPTHLCAICKDVTPVGRGEPRVRMLINFDVRLAFPLSMTAQITRGCLSPTSRHESQQAHCAQKLHLAQLIRLLN